LLTEKLKEIDINFWDQTLSPGHLFIQMGPKLLSLLEAGQVIDKNYLNKYKNSKLFIESKIDSKKYEMFMELFDQLKNIKFEKPNRDHCKLIMSKIVEDWSSSDSHLLTFALACFNTFNSLPTSELSRIDNTDIRLFKKSLYSSCIAVVTAMSNDFYEFSILQDFYQITFVMDFGLCDASYSFHIANAVDAESTGAGNGLLYLEKAKASVNERNLFLGHPEKSYKLLESEHINLHYPELSSIVLYQHETTTGNGFPRGITKREVSSWDAICLYADSIVKMTAIEQLESNCMSYLISESNLKQDLLPVKRVFMKLKNMFHYFQENKKEERVAS